MYFYMYQVVTVTSQQISMMHTSKYIPTDIHPFPAFEQRDSWSSYGAVRSYSEVLYNLCGPLGESYLSDS